MILIIKANFNLFEQSHYDSLIKSIKKNRVSFFHSALGPDSNVIFYGTYRRSVVSSSDTSRFSIKLQRIYDKHTHLTHTLIPHLLVPYSTVPLPYQIEIICASNDMLPDLSILFNLDPKTLLHIRKSFHESWRRFLHLLLTSPETLSFQSVHSTGRQFMQMRGTAFLLLPT